MIEFEAKLSEFGTVVTRKIPKAVKKSKSFGSREGGRRVEYLFSREV